MTLRQFVAYAAKAVGVLTVSEAAAVSTGLIVGQAAGIAAGVIGVANAAVAFLLKNTPPAGPDRIP